MDLHALNDSLGALADEHGVTLADDALDALTHAVHAALVDPAGTRLVAVTPALESDLADVIGDAIAYRVDDGSDDEHDLEQADRFRGLAATLGVRPTA